MSNPIDEVARIIWETSRADEGTISYAGANIIARALQASGHVATDWLQEEWGVAKSWEDLELGWVDLDPSDEWVAWEQARGQASAVLRRYATDWLPADDVNRAEGDGKAVSHG